MLKQSTVAKLRTWETNEFAATISEPRYCPIMTEYMEKARPQLTSFTSAGSAIFRKS